MKMVRISVNAATDYLDTKDKLAARKALLEIKENLDVILVSLAKSRNVRSNVISELADKLSNGASTLKDLLSSKEDVAPKVETKPDRKAKTSSQELPTPKSRFPKTETPKITDKSKSKFADLSKVRELSSSDVKSLIKKIRVNKKKRDELIPKFAFYCFSLLEKIYAVTPYLEALKNDTPPKYVTFGVPYMSIERSKDISYSKDFVAMVLPFKVEVEGAVKYMSISAVCSTRNPEVLRRDYEKSTYYHVEFNEQERIMKAGIENHMPLIIKDNYETPKDAVMAVIKKLRD